MAPQVTLVVDDGHGLACGDPPGGDHAIRGVIRPEHVEGEVACSGEIRTDW